MDRELREWIARRFRPPAARAQKVRSLGDALTLVQPGDRVHLGATHSRGGAALWELLRRFHGTRPELTLLSVAMSTPISPLVHAGLAARLVTSWAGDSYWAPGPNGAYQRAWRSGIEFEHWSILTFTQRLAAAAKGHPFAVTRSLRGSSMEQNEGVRRLDDDSLMIPALVPDVSLFHAPAADEEGTVLFSPPMMENVWGALAARRGVIVTVDRLVDTSYVRAHAHMARLPSSAVTAVVEAPFGAHPSGLRATGLGGIRSYVEDYPFWVDLRAAARDPRALDEWTREWVLETKTHEGYLDRVGRDRLTALERAATSEPEDAQIEEWVARADLDAPANAVETAIVAGARELHARAVANGYTTILAGAGIANMSAWLAGYTLADEDHPVDLAAEMGLIGYWPRAGEPVLFNQRNFPTCTMLTDIDTTLGLLVGGARARAIGALGAAQVDRHGNINSTMLPGESLLMGSGGANDVITCAAETVLVLTQSRERFVERVPYVTGPGARVRSLVSTLGVFTKVDDELVLTEVFDANAEAAAREARERCGWDLRVARDLRVAAPPTREELRTLRMLDPEGHFRA